MNNYLLTNMDTIDKINYYLTKNKKTGADLCEFLGVSSGVYSQWNTRRTKPRKSKLPAIAEYLCVSVADLLPDEEPSAGIKKAPTREGEVVSPVVQEIFDFLDSASMEEIAETVKYIRYLKSQRG